MTRRPPGYNQMLTDFGMYFNDMFKKNISDGDEKVLRKVITKKLNEIDHNFDLILLAEEGFYEDGIILLRHALCWEFEDIINVKRNTFTESNLGHNIQSHLSDESRKIIKGKLITLLCPRLDSVNVLRFTLIISSNSQHNACLNKVSPSS